MENSLHYLPKKVFAIQRYGKEIREEPQLSTTGEDMEFKKKKRKENLREFTCLDKA